MLFHITSQSLETKINEENAQDNSIIDESLSNNFLLHFLQFLR